MGDYEKLSGFKNVNSNWRAYVFNEVWLKELLSGVEVGSSVGYFSETFFHSLPKTPLIEALPLLQSAIDVHTCVNITNGAGEVLVAIGGGTEEAYELSLFVPMHAKLDGYALSLYESFGIKAKSYIAYKSTLKTLYPSFGSVEAKAKDVKRVVVCTPVFKRLELLDLYMEYMCNFYLPALEWQGYDVILAVAGQEEEAPIVKKYARSRLVYIQTENNLGKKKNLLLNLARDLYVDYLIYIDSDDFIHPELTQKMIEVAEGNGYWSAVEPFCFFDAKTKTYGLFEGYDKSKPLYGWGMGSGRVFTSELLKVFGENPFAHKNKSMDWYIREQLSDVDVPIEKRLLKLEGVKQLPLGLKTEENIWAYDKYKIVELDPSNSLVDWLPPLLKKKYLAIGFDQKKEG